MFIDGTLRLSLAADTRALQMSSLLATASTVLLGFGFSNLSDKAKFPIAAAAFCCGSIFFVALLFAIRTIRPRAFNILGTLRSRWSDSELHGDLAQGLMSQTEVYEKQALENIESLTQNANRIKIAHTLFVLALPISVFVGLAVFACGAK